MNEKKDKKILRGRMAGIALEDLDSKLDMIVEVVKDSERRLSGRIDTLEANMTQQFEDVQLSLRLHGEKLQEHDKVISFLKQASGH